MFIKYPKLLRPKLPKYVLRSSYTRELEKYCDDLEKSVEYTERECKERELIINGLRDQLKKRDTIKLNSKKKVVIERFADTRTRVFLDGKEVGVSAYEIKQSVDEGVSVILTFPKCDVEIKDVRDE